MNFHIYERVRKIGTSRVGTVTPCKFHETEKPNSVPVTFDDVMNAKIEMVDEAELEDFGEE
jgi:hypothetical protein